MKFSDIIGHSLLKEQLRRGIDQGRVSHAQLFSGAAGVGALPLALAYIQYLNCEARHDGDSCGVCASCQQIGALAHPDLHLVFPVNKQGKKSGEAVLSDNFLTEFREVFERHNGYFTPAQWYERLDLGKTLRGAITAREADAIIRKLSFKPFEAKYKVMLIWLPEAMNEEASNKILKILEEPWDKTLFILVSQRPDLLLQTILSRVQEVTLERLEEDVLQAWGMEHGVTDASTARNMAHLANGDLLAMQRLVEGKEDASQGEHFESFSSLMRLSYNDRHIELIGWADGVAQLTREQQITMLKSFAALLRESYVIHAGLPQISYLWGEQAAFCAKFAPFVGSQNIEALIEQIEQASMQISQNGNPSIVFTHFALSVSKLINRK